MTTGVETFGSRLADAGVDVLYFIDPVMDSLSLIKARELFGDRMTLVEEPIQSASKLEIVNAFSAKSKKLLKH